MPSHSSRPDEAVTVAHASTSLFDERADLESRARALLSDAEAERAERYRHDGDRRMFLLGRLMARAMVGRALGCDPSAWAWEEGDRGRPEVAGQASDVRFNLAHSAGLVVCAVARGRAVGVDVEDLERRAPDTGVVERYCAPAEVADIRGHGERWPQRFLVYWTLKEAYLKARGLGIAVPLSEISFALEGDSSARVGFGGSLADTDAAWSFTLLRPTPRHLVAVAAPVFEGRPPAVTLQPFEP